MEPRLLRNRTVGVQNTENAVISSHILMIMSLSIHADINVQPY